MLRKPSGLDSGLTRPQMVSYDCRIRRIIVKFVLRDEVSSQLTMGESCRMVMSVNRRSLLAAAAAVPFLKNPARAEAQPILLRAGTRIIEVNGKPAKVFSLTGPSGQPGLQFTLGDRFRVRLSNETGGDTLIHWHGMTPPSEQDGVPMVSQPLLSPGGSYDYDFAIARSGTHWMHSHVGLQEQRLLAAPLIVHETAEPVFDEAEHVVLLHDFTFRDPGEILAELRSGGGAHAGHAMDHSTMDHSGAGGGQPAGMAMGSMLNDVVYDAYLANDRTLADPEIVRVERGGRIRLRIINACAASNLWVDLGELDGELVAVDGHAVHPVRARVFPLAIAQRADIRLAIDRAGAFPVLFRPEGVALRTGIVFATPDAPVARIGETGEAPAPALDLALEKSLRAVAQLRQDPVTRTETVMLTGGGADYSWGLNGRPSMHDTVFHVRLGEKIDVLMHNMTTMAHPMHLHGHYFKVVAIDGTAIDGALRDTVLVPPNSTVTVRFDADNPGTWAFHCHHVYHMNAGMMGTIGYVNAA